MHSCSFRPSADVLQAPVGEYDGMLEHVSCALVSEAAEPEAFT